ncbi:MAG: cell division protein FtsZ [Clostridia bacterium]|nr:cell division protein FtsZ [Clostridia bacterium]
MNFNEDLNICKIMVVGVGGAGNNAVNRMIEQNISTATFAAVNTDKQALMRSFAPEENRIVIGESLTKGLGAGSDPEVGEKAAEENRAELENLVEGTDLLFIAAGMGGGTGTGAAPVLAKIAKEKGCVTVAVVTKPFAFEGKKREENARKGISNLVKYVDTIIIIPNDKLMEAVAPDTPIVNALKVADDALRQGICGIADLISTPAMINLDFADVRTIIQNQGLAHMGVGKAKGENRVVEAVRQAVSSPLLETTIEGAKGVIINVTGGRENLTLGQVYEAARLVQSVVDDSANIIFGANVSEELQEEIEITVIATGFESKDLKQQEQPKPGQFTRPVPEASRESRAEAFENLMNSGKKPEHSEPEPQPEEVVAPAKPKEEKKELPSFMQKLFGKK